MKTVLITGCSSGFGRLAVRRFQREGWNVIATMRSPERETELVQLPRVEVARLDVTDVGSIQSAVADAVSRFGGIDVLVNNAGYGGHALFEQQSDAEVRAMFETNVFGVMNVTRAVLPSMRAKGAGCVINVTSMAGVMGAPTISVYAATKHAVQGLTEAMAFEYEPLGIRIRAVLPGAYPATRFNANTTESVDAGSDQLATHGRRLFEHLQSVAEGMANQGGATADPREVADAIFRCATMSEVPVHNPVGADSQMLIEMMQQSERQQFLDQLKGILMPSREV